MTPTELEVLKIIWRNKGKASISKIAGELRISTDYARLICGGLVRNKIIEFSEGQYKITNLGKKELEGLEVIERVVKPKRTPTHPPPSQRAPAKKEKKEVEKTTITKLSNSSLDLIKVLKKKGLRTLEDIATTSASRLMEMVKGLELKKAADMINEARDKLRKEGKEYLWE